MKMLKRSVIEKIEAELATLNQRCAALQARFDAAAAAVVSAQAARRNLLLDGDMADERALRKADAGAREAEDQRAALSDALVELGRRIEDAERRLEDERARVAREQAAAEREGAPFAGEHANPWGLASDRGRLRAPGKRVGWWRSWYGG